MNLKQKNIFYTSFVYFILILFFLSVRMFSAFGFFSFMGVNANYIIPVVIQVGIMFLLPVVLITSLKKQKFKTTFKDFGFKKIGLKAILICIALGVLIFFLNLGFSTFFNGVIRFIGFEPRSSSVVTEYPVWLLFVNLTLTALLPGICEEVAHRGMLLSGYKELGLKKALVLSSVLFGLVHLNIEQFFYASVVGFLIAGFAVISGNIIPGIIVHFINNALSVFATFAYVNNLPVFNLSKMFEIFTTGDAFFATLVVLTALLLISWLVLILTKQLFKETTYKNFKNIQQNAASKIIKEAYLKDVDNSRRAVLGEEVENFEDEPIALNEQQQMFINSAFPIRQTVKAEKYGKLLIIGSLVLGCITTICTFIWGVI